MFTVSINFVWFALSAEYSKDQPGKVASPALGQLKREITIPCPRSRVRDWFRETGSPVPSLVSPLILLIRLNMVLIHGIPPDLRGGVHLFI